MENERSPAQLCFGHKGLTKLLGCGLPSGLGYLYRAKTAGASGGVQSRTFGFRSCQSRIGVQYGS